MVQPLHTDFTKLLNLKSPIIAAPMFHASTPALAAAVSKFGGLGMIGAGLFTGPELRRELQAIRAKLNIPHGKPIPTGVGFVAWILDRTEDTDDPRLTAALEEMPMVAWFAFGHNIDKHIKTVREYDAKRAHKTKIFVMVQTVEQALQAANDWKVDAIVAQGVESGGHGSSQSLHLSNFIAVLTEALPNGPPIIATGGIMTGAQVASMLTLGASGVSMGTRFLCTHESMYPDEAKRVIISSGFDATVRSKVFDEVERIPFWPPELDARAIANKVVSDLDEGLDLEQRLHRYDESKAKGESDRLLIWAGVGVGFVKEIQSVEEVLEKVHNDAVAALKKGKRLLGE